MLNALLQQHRKRYSADHTIAVIPEHEQDSWTRIEQSLAITVEFLLNQRIHAAQTKGVGPCA